MASKDQLRPGALIYNTEISEVPIMLTILKIEPDKVECWDGWGVVFYDMVTLLNMTNFSFKGYVSPEELSELREYIQKHVPLSRRNPSYLRVIK